MKVFQFVGVSIIKYSNMMPNSLSLKLSFQMRIDFIQC